MSPTPKVCKLCGKVHARKNGQRTCSGHIHGAVPKEPCMRIPKRGFKACRVHGGENQAAKQAAEKVLAEQEVVKHFATFGKPIPHNLTEGVLEEIFWIKGSLLFIRSRIEELDPESVTWGITEYTDKIGGDDHGVRTTEKAAVNVWVKLLQEQQKLYIEFVARAHSMGIEERRIRLAEAYADHVLSFGKAVAERIKVQLAVEGWDREELEEVWNGVLETVIPEALREMKELTSG